MMLTKQSKISKLEYLPETGVIQVQESTIISEDGKELSRTFHRYVLDPAYDIENLADKPAAVQEMANLYWTEETINSRKEALRSRGTVESKMII